MGVYDQVVVGDRSGQIKAWNCRMESYGIGDRVPSIAGHADYDIVMREGGFVHVRGLRITGWTDLPDAATCFDKWGHPWISPETNKGEVDEAMKQFGFESSYFYEYRLP